MWLFVICLILLSIVIIVSSYVRCYVFNAHISIPFSFIDLFDFIRLKRWRNASSGELIAFTGLFGKGKTLSMVHKVTNLYDKFNNKLVYDPFRKKWVTQIVQIVSNVELVGYPFIRFESLKQIVELCHQFKEFDDEHDTLTYIYVCGDEFSVQLNSRNFKSNMDPTFVNTLLTCRHYHMSLFYTAQRFSTVDALLRIVTQTVVDCHKVWRLQGQKIYDGYELENCTNPELVKPIRSTCWFVRNKDYNSYDTLACVENLEHSALTGDLISEEEILNRLSLNGNSESSVVHTSRKAKKRKFHK